MIFLRQSTASQEVPMGPFLDSTDGNTTEESLSIANTDIKLWKTGATTLAAKNSGGATHIDDGVYYCTLDATDTATLGPLTIFVHVSGALAVKVQCCVLVANVYDALVAASDKLEVDATLIEGGDATDAVNAACDTAISDASLATASALATVDNVVDAILLDTAEIGAAGAGLTDIPWNSDWDTEVQSEATDALNAYDPPTNAEMEARTLLAASYATAAALATVDNVADAAKAVTDKLDTALELDGAVYRFTTNALEEAPSGDAGDATAANQTTILAHLAAIKGSGFVQATDSLEAIRDRGDVAWTGGGAGSGDTEVDHDMGGEDNLRYVDDDGTGIDNANVRAYLTSDYDAGTYTLRGQTTTGADGRWVAPMFLDAAEYTFVFEKPGVYGPDTKEVTVS